MSRNVVVTLPQRHDWQTYQRELSEAHARGDLALFKVAASPDARCVGARCYVVHRGAVRGWMKVAELRRDFTFRCTTTGQTWQGNFIVREGPFHETNPKPMQGFQGWRYFTEEVQP